MLPLTIFSIKRLNILYPVLTLVSDVVVAFAVMFSLHQYRSDNDE